MFRKEFIIGVLATFFFMGFLGTAFAENSEKNHVYNQDRPALVGTDEAGDWEFKFDAPETKSDLAAKNYDYNQDHMALVGTDEAGDWEFKFDVPEAKARNANEAVAEKSNVKDAVCKGC